MEFLIAYLEANFPWLVELGLMELVTKLVTEDATAEQILIEVRNSSQYKGMFPGMFDGTGQRRFNSESEYLDTVRGYRQVLQEFGVFDLNSDTPMAYAAFMERGIDPNELQKRFQIYREVERTGQDAIDAFYVYAGLDITIDDLYQAIVSPEFANELTNTYDQAVAGQTFDYETWITRATEVGLRRTTELLRDMQKRGLITGQVVNQLLNVDPNFARQMMGAIFIGGDPATDTATMGLDELMATFDYAMLASAATASGLRMPDKQRIQQLRSAGVDRAAALRSYGQYSASKERLAGMAQRIGRTFTQDEFERAVLLGEGGALSTLQEATAAEAALGRGGGGFSTQLDQSGRIVQVGRQ